MGLLRNFQEISSVSEYVEAIFDLRKSKMAEYALSSYWFFRGQKNASWGMCPNIFRKDALRYEFDSIEAAVRQRPYDFRECSTDFEILTKLQHYGLGTRLLDVTLNPLIALYFASEHHEEFEREEENRGRYVPSDGKVVYQYGYGHKLSELDVRIACALPFIEFTEGLTLSDLCRKLGNRRVITPDEQSALEGNEYKRLIHAIQKNRFVVSSYSNERLTRQNGAFIIPSAIKIIGDELKEGQCLVRKARCDLDDEFEKTYFIIPADKKKSIRDELDFLNINEATLFPEFEHQLNYLQNKRYPDPGQVEVYEKFSEETKQLIDNGLTENTKVVRLEPHPNIQRIMDRYFSEYPICSKQITHVLTEATSIIDWWTKDSVISRMNLDITKILQKEMPREKSKELARKVKEEMLASGSE